MTFEGKNILITGASKGLGAVISNHFGMKGARLSLMARSKGKLESIVASLPNQALHSCIAVDFLNSDGLLKALDKISDTHFDIIIHCAGGGMGFGENLLTSEDLTKVFKLNIGVAAEINRMFAPSMIKNKKGNIIHIGSVSGKEVTASVSYGTIKAALAGYVKSVGRKLAVDNVIACGIVPGGFYAPENAMWRFQTHNPDGYKEYIEKNVPNQRMPLAEDFLPIIELLCSEKASPFASCLVPIDGGQSISFYQ